MEHMEALVISTKHVRKETGTMLDVSDASDVSGFPRFVGCYGWIVFVSEPGSVITEDGYPDLLACLEWARAQGYDWLRFDGDADTVDALPTYEWDDAETLDMVCDPQDRDHSMNG